jgi:hypothetical protein
MTKDVCAVISYFAALLGIICLSLSYAIRPGDGFRTLRSDEQRHVELATEFVEQARLNNGTLPSPRQFSDWANSMDAAGYRFEGRLFQYALYSLKQAPAAVTACFGPAPSGGFAFSFWTGEEWVTAASWRKDPHVACVESQHGLVGRLISPRWLLAIAGGLCLLYATFVHLESEKSRA